jgi:hypothetical protein
VALPRAEDALTCCWARYADVMALESGAAPRKPSPWLGEVERTTDALEETQSLDTARVADRIARIRDRLAASEPDGRYAPPSGGRPSPRRTGDRW